MVSPISRNIFSQSLAPQLGGEATTTIRAPVFKTNSVAEAVSRKLVESMVPTTGNMRSLSASPPSMYMGMVANRTAININDAENMVQLLPDISLAMQVLISSVLAPADMMSCELTYATMAEDLGDLAGILLDEYKDFFENTYKIKTMLEPILKDILFMKGSYPLAILPESVIDDAINGNSRVSMESLKTEITSSGFATSKGILGNGSTGTKKKKETIFNIGMEALDFSVQQYEPFVKIGKNADLVSVTDNPNVLKWPGLHDKLTQQRVHDAYARGQLGMGGVSMETIGQDMLKSTGSLYKPRSFSYTPILTLRTIGDVEKENVGHPLILNLPPEAVIPVHVPGNPDQHIGYFVVVDRHGNPIKAKQTKDFYADLQGNRDGFKDMASQLLARTRSASEGLQPDNELIVEQAVQMYTEIVENDLKQRLTNGLYGENVQISRPEEIYRIMFARACEKMMTQLVFIPTSQFVYMAFDYNDFGVGKSLLEDTKILGSIRAMLLFANTMAAIKNSINHVKVNIKLDPNDPDPDRTVEYLMHEYAKTKQAAYPIGSSNPLDMVNFLQTAGLQFLTTGHDGYVETEVTTEDMQRNVAKIDTELDEMLKKRHMMAMNVSPETVEASMNVDFATSVISSNILLAKRGLVIQGKFTPFLEDWMRKYAVNSGFLMNKLVKIVKDNRTKLGKEFTKLTDVEVVIYFLNSVKVSLPAPNLSRMKMQKEEFENYSQFLDEAIPAFVSSDIFDTSALGEVGNNINSVVAIIKAYYLRRFMMQNNIMPELFELTTFTEDEGPAYNVLDEQLAYIKGMTKSLQGYLIPAAKLAIKSDEKIQKARGDNNDSFESSASSQDSGGGEGGGEGDSGGDDFGGGDDFADMGVDSDLQDSNPDGGETPTGEEGGGGSGEGEAGKEEEADGGTAPEGEGETK